MMFKNDRMPERLSSRMIEYSSGTGSRGVHVTGDNLNCFFGAVNGGRVLDEEMVVGSRAAMINAKAIAHTTATTQQEDGDEEGCEEGCDWRTSKRAAAAAGRKAAEAASLGSHAHRLTRGWELQWERDSHEGHRSAKYKQTFACNYIDAQVG